MGANNVVAADGIVGTERTDIYWIEGTTCDGKECWADGFCHGHKNTWIDVAGKVAAQEDEEEEEEEADWEAVYAREKPREDNFRPGIQSNARLPFSAGVEDTRNVHRYH